MNSNHQTVAITGANGFIGRHLCRTLTAAGHSVTAIGRDLKDVPASATGYPIKDLTDSSSLRRGFRGATVVVHLAGRAHVMRPGPKDSHLYRHVNVDGTIAVADAAAAEGVGHVIFGSSVKAIGEGRGETLDDSTPPHPLEEYGRSKLEAEQELLIRAERHGFTATVLRFPLVYGPGVKGNMLRLYDAVWKHIPLPVGGIRNERTMLGLDNLAAFVTRAIELPLPPAKPFLLSDAESVSTETLVRMIGRALKRAPLIIPLPLFLLRGAGALGDMIASLGLPAIGSNAVDRLTGSLRVSSSRAWQAAGLDPVFSLEQGIARTAEWYVQRTTRQRG
jgi:nucleoside-diphosphate-sugar epimerase